MKSYRFTRDVEYYKMKKGTIYHYDDENPPRPYGTIALEPLLELGVLEEVKSPLPLTVENIKDGEEYWYIHSDYTIGASISEWGGHDRDKRAARLGLFRTQEEAMAHFKKLCEYSDRLLANDETV